MPGGLKAQRSPTSSRGGRRAAPTIKSRILSQKDHCNPFFPGMGIYNFNFTSYFSFLASISSQVTSRPSYAAMRPNTPVRVLSAAYWP